MLVPIRLVRSNVMTQHVFQNAICTFSMTIRLGVKRSTHTLLRPNHTHHFFHECTSETWIPVGHHFPGHSMQTPNVPDKQLSHLLSCATRHRRYKMYHLGKTINKHNDSIMLVTGFWQ